ncbi:type II secretion system protein [uncultured Piscinibacter sp.]|uniref:type II secretion system protein n=1 Tax=uncultured Piscinibacter sp. TaxID=1131835 RepID=UPI0026326F3E|nr:type II secretion system protein [uncultured Piscinibacter sp.]
MRAGERPCRARREGGFTYFVVLLLVVVTSTGAVALGTLWQTAERRERERELLEAGRELRRAIDAYRRLPVGGKRQFPPALEDLLRDPRLPGVRRHLRRIPVDPVTGRDEWGLVLAADGGILGVHSLSQAAPMKTAGFAPDEADFEGAARHADWVFQVREQTAPAPPAGWKPASPLTR